jgi:hypothetical protein
LTGILLGHIVLNDGVSIEHGRISYIQRLLAPTSKKDIKDFMGKTNVVHGFVPNVSKIINPINLLLPKDTTLYYNNDAK